MDDRSGGEQINALARPATAAASVFISHPKSGRTWVRYFLHLRGIELPFRHVETGLGHRLDMVDTSPADGGPIVFMHRNPIDTAVSYYFQIHKRELPYGSWKYFRLFPRLGLAGRLPPRDMRRFMLHPGYGVERICRFNAAWLAKLAGREDALIMSYEAARADTVAEFTRLLDFIGTDTTDVAATVEQARFERMREKEQTDALGVFWLRQSIKGDPQSAKVRSGKVRGYGEHLDEATIAQCREICARFGFEA